MEDSHACDDDAHPSLLVTSSSVDWWNQQAAAEEEEEKEDEDVNDNDSIAELTESMLLQHARSLGNNDNSNDKHNPLDSTLCTAKAASKFLAILRRRNLQRNIYTKHAPHPLRHYPHSREEKQFLVSALRRNWIFGSRTVQERREFAHTFQRVWIQADTVICRQGDEGDYFYVLQQGKVAFTLDDSPLGSMDTPGAAFGELSLLYTAPRAATVTAVTDCTVFRADPTNFTHTAQVCADRTRQQKIQLLSALSWIAASEDNAAMEVWINSMTPRLFAEGQQFKLAAGSLWLLHAGQLQCRERNNTEHEKEYNIFREGDCLGQEEWLEPKKDAAEPDVYQALTNGMAYTIDRTVMEKALGVATFDEYLLQAQQSQRLQEQVAYFAAATPSQRRQLVRLCKSCSWAAGEFCYQRDQVTHPVLYFVRSGLVKVTDHRGETRAIGEGEFFGEELLRHPDARHQVTVTSKWSAKAVDATVCSLLTLRSCRTLFDTEEMHDEENHEPRHPPINDDESAVAIQQEEVSKQQAEPKKRKILLRRLRPTSGDIPLNAMLPSLPDDVKDLSKHVILGEGTFGQVWLVSSPLDKEIRPYALKIQSKHELVAEHQVKSAIRERQIMQELCHPFLIQLHKTYQDSHFLYCVIDFVQGGELFSLMHPNDECSHPMPENQTRFYCLGIADALAFMHSKKLIHRDLKPENVLIDAKGYPVLIDMGFAKKVVDKTYTVCGTPGYLAPEVILSQGHDGGADNWSLGILIAEMLVGDNPFYDDDVEQTHYFRRIVREPYYPPDHLSGEAKSLIFGLLAKDPMFRIGSRAQGDAEILNDPWFDELEVQFLRKRRIKAPWVPETKDVLDTNAFDDWSDLEDKSLKTFPDLSEEDSQRFASY